MSPGSQIRALTAKKATPKSITINIGNSVERKKDIALGALYQNLVMLTSQLSTCCILVHTSTTSKAYSYSVSL